MSKKVLYANIARQMAPHSHGVVSIKDVMVLHESVSRDVPGLSDIAGIESTLEKLDYGIHGITDLEGHKAWALGCGRDIFYHAGGVNSRACGIEQVSYIPALIEQKVLTTEQAWKHWLARDEQLHATAQLVAAWHNGDPGHRPLVFSDGDHPGVTSHWNVSQHHPESEGHWDCHPHHLGGHYPIMVVISYARVYAREGYHF